jgi:Sulfotransferase family
VTLHPAPKVLFIAGVGRSGSTLIDQVLGEVEGFCSLGELHTLWMRGLIEGDSCGCGVRVPDCPFWNDVLQQAFGTVEGVRPGDKARLIDSHLRTRPMALLTLTRDLRSGRPSPARTYGAVLGEVYRSAASVSNSRVVIDSTKVPSHALVASTYAGADVYLLHLVRDPRAVAFSWAQQPDAGDRQGHSRLDFEGMNHFRSSAQWLFRAAAVEGLLRPRLGRRYMQMRYEEFAAAPRQTAAALLSFLGEENAALPFIGENTVRLGANHILSGNRSKFRRGQVAVALDQRWRRDMSISHQIASTSLAWPLMHRYGYRIAGSNHARG